MWSCRSLQEFSLHIFASVTPSWAYKDDKSLFHQCLTSGDVAPVTTGSPQLCAAAAGHMQALLGPHPSSSQLPCPSQTLALVVGDSVLRGSRALWWDRCSPRMEHSTYAGQVLQNLCGTNPCVLMDHRVVYPLLLNLLHLLALEACISWPGWP